MNKFLPLLPLSTFPIHQWIKKDHPLEKLSIIFTQKRKLTVSVINNETITTGTKPPTEINKEMLRTNTRQDHDSILYRPPE